LREFILKFLGNILGLGVRIAHFVQGASRSCTFCINSVPPVETDETFIHLFFDCPRSGALISRFLSVFFQELDLANRDYKLVFWFTHAPPAGQPELNSFEHVSLWIFKFLIWEAKLKKKNPSFETIKIDFLFLLSNATKVSKTLEFDSKNGNHYYISRNWARLVRDAR